MSKKPIIGGIILAAIIGMVFVGAQINPDNPENEGVVFHVTLAEPNQYECERTDFDSVYEVRWCDDQWREYRDSVLLEKGEYMFRFVANGDSPKVLTVRISYDFDDHPTQAKPYEYSKPLNLDFSHFRDYLGLSGLQQIPLL